MFNKIKNLIFTVLFLFGNYVYANEHDRNEPIFLESDSAKWDEESQKSRTRVVMLIPARTDTKYWHDYVMKADVIYFVKGRLKFGGSENAAPFPSAVVVFGSQWSTTAPTTTPKAHTMERP